MNIVLVNADELSSDAVATLRGRRAEHILQVLRPTLGSTLRAGIIDGVRGKLVVQAMAADSVTVQFLPGEGDAAAPALVATATAGAALGLHELTVVLAVPRPKVLRRVVESLATFGVRRVVLCNSWRVDKAYLASPRMALAALREDCVLGAEQGGHTRLPQLVVYPRFMQMLDTEFAQASGALEVSSARVGLGQRLVAHPGAALDALGYSAAAVRPQVVAIGPEGGWIDRELTSFADRGFAPLWLSSSILRVETAVAVVLGQLELAARAANVGRAPDAASASNQEPRHG